MELKKTKLFDEEGIDGAAEQIIGGNPTGIANLVETKFGWTKDLIDLQLERFWIPQKISLVDDLTTIKHLSEDEEEALKSTLSFLIFLDSLQTLNLSEIMSYVTSPSLNVCLATQNFFEGIHSRSYSYMLETLYPKMDHDSIFYRWRDNDLLLERIKYATQIANEFRANPTDETFIRACANTYAVESLMFYVGFIFFHLLASRGMLVGCNQIITLIKRDELLHVSIFANIFRSLELSDDQLESIREVYMRQADFELRWVREIYSNNIMGMTIDANEQYVRYLSNNRLNTIGIERPFERLTNPYKHLETENNDRKESFFESTVTKYSKSETVGDWDW